MDISFQYNWPPGNKFIRVSFGPGNIKDPDYLFRIGVVKEADLRKVYWQGPEEWNTNDQLVAVKFDAEKGDKIVLDRKDKQTDSINLKHSWDTAEEWPPQAYGGSMTVVPYCL